MDSIKELVQGTTILVDKEYTWTSFDAVNKLRWHLRKRLGVKKLKVGHAGTLDPLATGLLVICIGKHTKLIDQLTKETKQYTGTILLGKETPSYDLETEYYKHHDLARINLLDVERVRESFIGVQEQVPPLFSAKQIDGKRAYELARAGKEVALKSNTIEIFDFQINTTRYPEIDFEIHCSKGTYIRSIAHDFGKKLNVGATLIALRRTASGDYNVKDASTVSEWVDFFENLPLDKQITD